MIGFYNVSVILTYIGLASSVCGMFLALEGELYWAIICLMFSGVCDMFDGKIARRTKRTEDAKLFGIQIDSLCDLVCFGVFPVIICRCAGVGGVFGIMCLVLFVLAAVIRLGYYNVTEQKRQQETEESRKYFQGMPVSGIPLLLTMYYMTKAFTGDAFPTVLAALMLVNAVLNVANIRVRKPGPILGCVMILMGIALASAFFVMSSKGLL